MFLISLTPKNFSATLLLLIPASFLFYCVDFFCGVCPHLLYTCQLFLRYRREIFLLGVLKFLKMTRSFPKIFNEFQSLPKNSEVFRKRPKSQSQYKRELAPIAFHFKNQRSRGRYCHLVIIHMVFVPYMGLS